MKRTHLFWLIFLSFPALAGERYEFFNGVRALGMGGASVAVVNDETALLTNPAALGKLRDYFITVIDPEISVSAAAEQIAGTELIKMIQPQEALNRCLLDPNKHLQERAQIFPSIVVPNFGFGVFGKYEVNAEVDSTSNTFLYDYTNDFAMVFGFNLRLFNGIMKIGANARVTNRAEVRRDDIATTETALSLKDLAAEGLGIGSDVGTIIALPVALLPTLAIAYRDVGRTSYSFRDGMFMNTDDRRPESTAESVDVALAIYPILGKRMRSSWTVEYRDVLTYSDETDQMRRLHAGVEFNFADAFFMRAGMNQRYWTAGLELSMMNYQFQGATYGEDIGVAGNSREDRRYVVKFAFRF